jgi:hypothetical protein
MLEPTSTITINTSWLQGTSIWLHIGGMVADYHPSLCIFENIGVFWSILFYSEETVLSIESSKLSEASSTITIWTSWLQGTSI